METLVIKPSTAQGMIDIMFRALSGKDSPFVISNGGTKSTMTKAQIEQVENLVHTLSHNSAIMLGHPLDEMPHIDNRVIGERNAKTYRLLKDGEEIEIHNMAKYCRDNDLNLNRMRQMLCKQISEYKGFTLKPDEYSI